MDNTEQPLTDWKAIAKFLGCTISEAIRYRKEFGMPVYQVKTMSKVRAFKSELNEWIKQNSLDIKNGDNASP